jgi:hypothetical protein
MECFCELSSEGGIEKDKAKQREGMYTSLAEGRGQWHRTGMASESRTCIKH